ncbi:MAG: carboxypeptidase-like regulatory domain-containing protein [Thermodesulfobacteriota bacterium]
MRRILSVILFFFTIVMISCGGGGGGGSDVPPMGTLLVTVDAASDASAVENASVSVYDDKNLVVINATTDVDGEFEYPLSPGSYYVKVAAQGYNPVPLKNQAAIPFEIIDDQTTTESVMLDAHPNAGNTGQVSGMVMTPAPDSNGVADVLVVAEDSAQDLFASCVSGLDGDFVLYNVEPGTYTLSAYRSGYRQLSDPVVVDVLAEGIDEENDIEIVTHGNADLSGQITFLAITNGIVDITLIHPDTGDTIPGLSTFNDANLTYLLESIPPGTYIAWASFRNDGYVMDPDWIFKSGLPVIIFDENSLDQELDFSVTGAVTITDPTNEASLVVPEIIHTDTPTFSWNPYPSTKEYIVEVYDSQGNTIWGGYDDTGVVQHPQIDFHKTSEVFNFDGSATSLLQDGETYRWKIYADNDDAANVQTLISSSEDQMGLFTYIQN